MGHVNPSEWKMCLVKRFSSWPVLHATETAVSAPLHGSFFEQLA